MTAGRRLHMVMWALVGVLVAGGIFVVFNRVEAIHSAIRAGVIPPQGSFEEPFVLSPVLALFHLLPSLLFVVLGPLQFMQPIRKRYPILHRISGRVYLIASALIAYSALHLVFNRSFGGPSETAATVYFTILFVACLATAYRHVRNRRFALHREWMIRGFAIGIAVVTIRPVVGLYMLFSDYSVQEIIGAAFWISFTSHLVAAEAWVRLTRAGTGQATA